MFMRMIYDEKLAQAAYMLGCQWTGEAIVIDPERDVDRYIDLAAEHGLRIVATAETHIHADFVSGSRELAERVGAKVYVSDEGDADWKYQWLSDKVGGGAYDHQLLRDDDRFRIGGIELKVMHTPGHTPEHIAFLVTDRGAGAKEPLAIVTGDFVFVGDLGRPDLLETAAGQAGAMEPSARQLFRTVHKLGAVPDFVQVWPAHGAGSACGKALGAVPMSTVGYERRFNPAIRAAVDEQGFVDFILSGQPEPPLYFANMKRVNKIGPAVLGSLPIPPRRSIADLRELDTRRVALVDTRPWDTFRSSHVNGSLSCPLDRHFSGDVGSMVHESELVYLVVEPGELEEAVRDLVRIGLDNLAGWFDASNLDPYEDETHHFAALAEAKSAEAEVMIEQGSVQLLDVRRAAEFADGHLAGATNLSHTRLAARLDEIARDTRWLVYCRTGRRSARVVALLAREGFGAVNLRGGLVTWERTDQLVEA